VVITRWGTEQFERNRTNANNAGNANPEPGKASKRMRPPGYTTIGIEFQIPAQLFTNGFGLFNLCLSVGKRQFLGTKIYFHHIQRPALTIPPLLSRSQDRLEASLQKARFTICWPCTETGFRP